MDIKPFLHEHYLQFDFYSNEEASTCDKCHRQIDGWAYSCESCPDFWLHSDCAEQQLPPQISHPLHTQHPLTLTPYRDFICQICSTLSRGHNYWCRHCGFAVDVSCAAASTNDATPHKLEAKRLYERMLGIPHFVHEHYLAGFFNYRKVRKRHLKCGWCEKLLSGMTSGCLQCEEDFYFHESCLSKIPTKLSGHSFHSSHPLYVLPTTVDNNSSTYCDACNDKIVEAAAYGCRKCDFQLHALCSRIQPSLKHEIHEHTLTYFQIKPSASCLAILCKICDKNIYGAEPGENKFYRCVECNFSFHLKCLEIPLSIRHGYHRHALTLYEKFDEDDSGEYYCDICEEERKAKHLVYCCEKCTFISHIQCALNKVDNEVSIQKQEKEEIEKGEAESQNNDIERQIGHFIHGHPLSYYEKIEKSEHVLCEACNMEIDGEAYGCESCKYYLHNQCAKLPYEVVHPLHPQHPLQIFDHTSEIYSCDECGNESVGFSYICYFCSFMIDVKCVNLTKSSNEDQGLKVPKLCPFKQDHELSFINVRLKGWFCCICLLQLSGLTIYCPLCDYVVHESCHGFPWETALPFHLEHPLHLIVHKGSQLISCRACSFPIPKNSVYYNCEQSEDITLHLSCANALWRAIRSKSHPHPLFYFGTECQNVFACDLFKVFEEMKCVKCHKPFGGVHFYRCIYCDVNFHLECVPVSYFIESKCHIHPLTLRDCFIEDNSGEYYCDVCEEERHPKDHVYFCEECQELFVAHIECVFSNLVEEIAPAQEPSLNSVLDFDKVPLRRKNIRAEFTEMKESTEEQQSD